MTRMSTPAFARWVSSRIICGSVSFGSQMTSDFLLRLMNIASCSRAFSGLTTKPSKSDSNSWRRTSALEQPKRLLNEALLADDDAEASALQIECRVVESVHVQLFTIHDQQLAVIAGQVVRRPRDGDTGIEHPQFQLAQTLVAAGVSVGDERTDRDAALHRRFNRLLHGFQVEPEDGNVQRGLRPLDRGKDGLGSVCWLYDEFQRMCLLNLDRAGHAPADLGEVRAKCWPF